MIIIFRRFYNQCRKRIIDHSITLNSNMYANISTTCITLYILYRE